MIPFFLATTLIAADTGYKVPVTAAESLYVETRGDGPTVVLIPGLFGSAFGFRHLIPLLVTGGYRTVVIEPLGIGNSSRPPKSDYSLLAQSDRIAAVLESLGIKRSLVIAHSLGGAMALRVAYRRPELVEGLILLESGPTERATTPAFRKAMRFVPWIKVFGGMRLIRRKIRHSLIYSSGDPAWVTDSVVSGYTAGAAVDLDKSLKAFLAMARSRERESLQLHLSQVVCPVRLLVGTAPHDGYVPDEEVRLMVQSLGHFAVDSIDGVGHFIHEERPEAVMTGLHQVEQMEKSSLSPQLRSEVQL
jgi:pimeloyl-ACP methyl ester carboxylesterase